MRIDIVIDGKTLSKVAGLGAVVLLTLSSMGLAFGLALVYFGSTAG